MRVLFWPVLVSSLFSHAILSLARVSPSDVKKTSTIPEVPNKFIVEVDSISDISHKRSLSSPHEKFYDSLKKRNILFDVDKEYDVQGLFVGVALTLNNAQDAAALVNTPGVKAIRPVRTFARPSPVKVHVVSGPHDPIIPPDTQTTHILTGVDRLHAEGILGKGIKIGIIDTGIDYTHPALGGGFGPGYKVVGGYDLVGDNYNGANTPVPDPDPLDQCAGHGTHVAGIIGANPGNPFNISGVAYEASLSAYRVFGCTGTVTDDVIIDALLRGFQDAQDVLTLSLGGTDGWTESSSSVLASRIAGTGVVVTIAAGNDGDSGSWYTSSPGNGINVISVASLDNTVIPLQNLTVGNLVEQFVAGVPVTITFPQTGASTEYPDPTGGLISPFTSYGPTNDMYFKPAVAAPGGNILSTIPTTMGSYAVESGTSMATPYVAGSAALILSVKGTGDSVGKNARTLFETTAQRVPSTHTDGDPLQTVTQQGAGLINVYKAVYATTVVTPGELLLNDTAHFKPLQKFTVTNNGPTLKEYALTHVPAGTALTVYAGTIFPSDGPVPLTSAPASVLFDTPCFTLAPGASHTVILAFTPPEIKDRSTFPVFSGFIEITSGKESHHVTYLGLAASLKDKQVVDNTAAYFGSPIPAVLDQNNNFQTQPTNYTFVGNSWPSILFRLTFGTSLLRIDLVDSDTHFTPTLNPRDLSPHITFPQTAKLGTFKNVKIVGPISELDYTYRNNEDADTNGWDVVSLATPTFANGTTIPNGQYRFLLRALKVTGNPGNEDDFESWLGPIIGIYA
ncbi:hypothetical protein H0H93_002893 [Arthromyces matolae]|nr:hypothetical protein H0H93_002893 [Arthromyces matolae]